MICQELHKHITLWGFEFFLTNIMGLDFFSDGICGGNKSFGVIIRGSENFGHLLQTSSGWIPGVNNNQPLIPECTYLTLSDEGP